MTGEHIPVKLRDFVRLRARDCCEYCLLPQSGQEATFHGDHINARSRGGLTVEENLALACVGCSLRKSARVRGVDPVTKSIVALYHPRSDEWSDHFRWTPSWRVNGRTAIGRATIEALGLNRRVLVRIRALLARQGRFPPRG